MLKALKVIGWENPSAIQAATIPPLLAGRDVVGLAQTGTGKTAAFALPILARLDMSQKTPQALVLAPTRELALQVCEAFESYAAHMRGVHVLPVYGGQGYGVQLSALRRGVHIVVGNPGRIMDHLEKKTPDLSALKYLVLDEADEMLKMGFAEDVETILADTPEDKQVALFSATMPASIRRISKQYLNDPEEITVKNKTTTSANTTQRYLVVSYPQKVDALTRILEVENFRGHDRLRPHQERRPNCSPRSSVRAAIRRWQSAATFRRCSASAPSTSSNPASWTSCRNGCRGARSRRRPHQPRSELRHPDSTPSPTCTASAAPVVPVATAPAISFVTPRERRLLTAIEKATRQPLTQMQLPSVEDVNVTRLTRFDDAITEALSQSDRISQFRDIISHYVDHHDVPESDVAAALAVVAQGETHLLLTAEDVRAQRNEREERDRSDRPARSSDRNSRDDRPPRGDRNIRGGDREERRDHSDHGDRAVRTDRNERFERSSDHEHPEKRSRDYTRTMASYRIEVGKRHKVEPRQIVGALANEGGLSREDFGAIKILPDFSIC